MRIVIAGANGQIARQLTRELVARGHDIVGIIRKPAQIDAVRETGAIPFVLDLEEAGAEETTALLAGADVVVFAAGAGPGSGVARKDTVDHKASVLLADAAEAAQVPRFVQISAMGMEQVREGRFPDGADAVFTAYLVAKLAAEDDLRRRDGLDWTVLRPGRLTNHEPTGAVELGPTVTYGSVPRADVAAVLAELIDTGAGSRQVLELVSGAALVAEAVAALLPDASSGTGVTGPE